MLSIERYTSSMCVEGDAVDTVFGHDDGQGMEKQESSLALRHDATLDDESARVADDDSAEMAALDPDKAGRLGLMVYAGGCLCGALRYEAEGEPLYAGHCYCADCRKASGSGFVGFMGFASGSVRFSGPSSTFTSKAANGGDADRSRCPACGSLVFGGIVGRDVEHTIYAGSLDDPAMFKPTIAIFTRDRPEWATLPPRLTAFEAAPT